MSALPAAPYDAIADVYDELSPGDGHAAWVQRLLAVAREHGLTGRRVLDVACGSGRSFGPLLDAGMEICGLDLSRGMLRRAAERHGAAVRLVHGDMRAMPVLGEFDLAVSLDDALNHLTGPGDVAAAFRGVAANLAPGGLLLFDVCALGAYRSAAEQVLEGPDRVVVWRPVGARGLPPGGLMELRVDVLERGDGAARRWVQPHRHHPRGELDRALRTAGFEVVRRWGQQRGGVLCDGVDEPAQHKVLVLARRIGAPASTRDREEGA